MSLSHSLDRRNGVVAANLVIALLATALGARIEAQAAGERQGSVLLLEQATAIALENNRLVRNAVLDVEKAQLAVERARTQRFPSFDFRAAELQLLAPFDFIFPAGSFGVNRAIGAIPPTDTPIETPRRPNTVLFFSVAQPISQLHRIGLGVRLYETAADISREKERAERQTIVNNVKKAYYGLVQTQRGLEATEEALKLYRELDRVVGDYVLRQAALKSDSLEVKTRLARTEYDALTLRNTQAALKEQLNELLGRDARTEFEIGPIAELTADDIDLETARARALDRRPEVREARMKLQQAQYDQQLKKAERFPDVTLTFLQGRLFNFEILPQNLTAVAGLVTWEPFDWGRKRREIEEKNKTIEQATNGIKETEAMVLVDVGARFRKQQETRALLRVATLALDERREKLRVVTNRVAQESALTKDALQAQASLAEATYQYQQALVTFWTGRAELEKAVGEDERE